MLLCDGCDLGCHIACMRPALPAVPAGDWLCWHCEAQVQGTALPPAAAGRCVALLLQMDEPRQLLCNHELFPRIIEVSSQRRETLLPACSTEAQPRQYLASC